MAAKQSTFWKEHLPTLRKLAEAGLTDRQIEATGLIPGKSHSSIMNARTRYGIAGGTHARDHHIAAFSEINRVVSANPERIILGSDDTEEEPFDELLERAIKQTKRAVRKAKMRRYAVARIVTDRPIGVAWASDQHLTMHGPVDVERAFADARRVRTTEALYIVLGGDGVDNHVKHRAAMVNLSLIHI